MLRGLYTSALGLAVLDKQQEVTSNNLANAYTAGYKKDMITAESFSEVLLYRLNAAEDYGKTPPQVGTVALGVQIDDVHTDFSVGPQRRTDNPLSLALEGEGYFTVETPQGERYTRNGEFSLDAGGRMVTVDGYPLMGEKGEILIQNNDLQVDREGWVYSDGVTLDRLKIVEFSTPLQKEGSSLFMGDNPQAVANPLVSQGVVEESNVQPLTEMVNMITIMRAYESNQKVIQTMDQTLDKAVNEVGRL